MHRTTTKNVALHDENILRYPMYHKNLALKLENFINELEIVLLLIDLTCPDQQ